MDTNHQPGDVVHQRYRIVRPIGRGGAGTTYEAEDIETGGRVALKHLDVRNLGEWKKLDLFEREARTLKSIVHPAIPRYVDSFQIDEGGPRLYLVQELAPGRSLAELVAGGFHPDEAEVRRIAEKLLGILGYLESRMPPIVHRDIKPQNVLRGDDGEIFLVDFGAVNDVRREGDGSTVVGTYGYMAPEQLRGQATSASDLYGLGATLVFLLTRRSPAELPQKKLKIDIREHARVSPDFGRWLDKLLEPAPEDRFATAREASLALQRGLPAAPGAGVRIAAAIGGAILVMAVGGGFALTRLHAARRAAAVEAAAAAPASARSDVRPARVLAAHWSAVFSVAFAPDGKVLATGSNDKTVKVWNAETGQPIRDLPVTGARVGAVAFTRDGASLLAASGNAVLVWDAVTGAPTRTLTGHAGPVTSIAIDPANKTIFTGSFDGTVRAWDRQSGEAGRILDHGGRVHALAVSPDGKVLASGGADGSVRLWDLATGAQIRALTHGATVDALAFAPDSLALVSAGDDHTAKVWLCDPGKLMHTFTGHTDEVWSVALQPDGHSVATSGKDGAVHVWDLYTGRSLRSFTADTKGVLSMATSPTGALLATAGGSGAVKLWSLGDDAAQRDEDVEDRAGWTPLHTAAWDGDLAAVKALLAQGAPVDARNARKRTPLYNAAKHGHLEVAAYLVDRGADVNATAKEDFTPMYVAVQNGHLPVVELLIAKGANLRQKNWFGQTYVYKAAESGHVDVAKLLIAKGATFNDADKWRWTPLTIACRHGHARMVELLLTQPGIELSATSGQHEHTPLMIAAESGHEDIVRQLLQKGVDVNVKAKGGETALSLAEQYKQRRIAEMLREHGAR